MRGDIIEFSSAIMGESVIAGHEDWIVLESMQFGLGRAVTPFRDGAKRETSNPSFSEISVIKQMDRSSAELMMQAAAGQGLGVATIHFIRPATADAKGQHFLDYKLGGVLLSSYSVDCHGGKPRETFSINYSGIRMSYHAYKDGTLVQTGAEVGWDLSQNQPF